MNKTIIIYFSYTGNTRKIANMIKDKLNCDVLELKPVIPYSNDYQKVVSDEQKLEGANHMPDIEDINVDLEKYDKIILGTPVWWYRETPVIRTFLNKYNLTGKTIFPFATNAGWLGKTFDYIKKFCPNSTLENGMNIVFESYGTNLITSMDKISEWINKLGE